MGAGGGGGGGVTRPTATIASVQNELLLNTFSFRDELLRTGTWDGVNWFDLTSFGVEGGVVDGVPISCSSGLYK